MIRLACPQCRTPVKLKDDYAGQTVVCPACTGRIDSRSVERLGVAGDGPNVENYSKPRLGAWVLVVGGLLIAASVLASIGYLAWDSKKSQQHPASADTARANTVDPREPKVIVVKPKPPKADEPAVVPPEVKPEEPMPKVPENRLEPEAAAPKPVDVPKLMDLPKPVRDRAIEILKAKAITDVELAKKNLMLQKDLLPRYRNGIVVRRMNTLIPANKEIPINFPSEAVKKQEIEACQKRITAYENAIAAFKKNDWEHFAADFSEIVLVGECGRFAGGTFITQKIFDQTSAEVEFKFLVQKPSGETSYEKTIVVLNGINTDRLAVDLETKCNDVFVVAVSKRESFHGHYILTPLALDAKP